MIWAVLRWCALLFLALWILSDPHGFALWLIEAISALGMPDEVSNSLKAALRRL